MGLVVGYMAYNNDVNLAKVDGWVTLIMLVLGIIIGVTAITAKEVTPFLIATIALIVAASANVWSPLGEIHEILFFWAFYILHYIVAFAAPAAVIIAVRSVLAIAKEK
jgi:hypothetical protein